MNDLPWNESFTVIFKTGIRPGLNVELSITDYLLFNIWYLIKIMNNS